MKDQAKTTMPQGNGAGAQQAAAQNMPGDFMHADEFRSAIGSMMGMMMNMGSGMMMPQAPAQTPDVPATAPTNTADANKAASKSSSMGNGSNAEVLFEACTMVQPMNQSLRKAHSMGTYYFLTGKNKTNG